MKRRHFIATTAALTTTIGSAKAATAKRQIQVTLPQAHKGTLEVDTQLLDSYGKLPANIRSFYLEARQAFASDPDADFTSQAVMEAASRNRVAVMGGPMLGKLTQHGVSIWIRPADQQPLRVMINGRAYSIDTPCPGRPEHIEINDLQPATTYDYQLVKGQSTILTSRFTTAPAKDATESFRLAFGSCCHKIGVHNQNLFETIVQRQPHAMMLLGDIAVDDRNNEVNMHRADYQLRDVSRAFSHLVSHVPVYAAWDDHDYFDNDLSGIPKKFTASDRDALRMVWQENWNNPQVKCSGGGIYFNSRVGPVEIVMLDTRSCRDGKRRNKKHCYLGKAQLDWLKQTLMASTAKFKVISSGTMWSDYVSKAKDSWGSWDKEVREELFNFIEENQIRGVLLVSGDRHGARGFRIPRPSGRDFYEFEPATLGGVSGPGGIVKNCQEQLFGYSGRTRNGEDFVAFGEFTFDTKSSVPNVTFRLIGEHGDELEKITLGIDKL